MAKKQKISDNQEIAQEERELKREYLIFVPILIIIVILITFAIPDSKTRQAVELVPNQTGTGYWMVYDNGVVENYGDSPVVQSISTASDAEVVAAASAGSGLWTVTNRGHIQALGGANYAGGIDSVYEQKEAAELITLPNGRSYRIITDAGKVYDFNSSSIGGGPSLTDVLGEDHNSQVVAAASTTSGEGYWLVTLTGDIYSFGDAKSIDNLVLYEGEEVVDVAQSGDGLLILTNRGRVLAMQGAVYHGGMDDQDFDAPLIDIDPTPTGDGYWISAIDGDVYSLGNAPRL